MSIQDKFEEEMKDICEEYDNPKVPVSVDKIVCTSERMRKGAKDKLREILSAKQWSEIYKEKEVVSYRVSLRD